MPNKTTIKDYVKSFGRVPVPPPTRVKPNRKGRGSYHRAREKQRWRKEVYGRDA